MQVFQDKRSTTTEKFRELRNQLDYLVILRDNGDNTPTTVSWRGRDVKVYVSRLNESSDLQASLRFEGAERPYEWIMIRVKQDGTTSLANSGSVKFPGGSGNISQEEESIRGAREIIGAAYGIRTKTRSTK